MVVFNAAVYLLYRGKTQVACNVMLPPEDNILNKIRIWKERDSYLSFKQIFV